MNRSDTEGKSANGAVVSNAANTRLTGSWLIIARVVWLVLVIPSLGLFLASLLVSYQQMLKVCVDPVTCNLSGALPAQMQQSLATIGFSVSGYAALLTIFFVLIAAIWYAVGFLIFWRRSDDWLALLAAFFLVMFNLTTFSGNPAYALAFAYPIFALPLSLVGFLGQTSFGVFFLALPQWKACASLDGTDPAARHHPCVLQQLPFHHVTFQYELANMAHPAGYSRYLWRHHLFANLPLQTRVHTCPAPTDEVDCLRS